MARKTQEESLAIKHRILDAAELVLLEQGVAQTAMADLAEAAGMSRGAVYGHYRNKMEVCLALCDRAFARTSEGFEAADLDVHLAAVYLVSLLEGVFASMIWTDRLRGTRWNDAEAMLDAGFDAVESSGALRVRTQKLPAARKAAQ
ncbi:TPA: TetR family transcriptional regulator [Burkholderia vietnamiensis]|nr:TetR family transcriptional regulator [Burkholderia vietnamiensis]HDR8994066.1 TetR family transcriptional regulator [Burkholderia vietnamiensis]